MLCYVAVGATFKMIVDMYGMIALNVFGLSHFQTLLAGLI